MANSTDKPAIPITTSEWNDKFSENPEIWLFGREASEMARLTVQYWKLVGGDQTGRVVDIGCGQGKDTIYFLQNAMDVISVDGSETALERLSETASSLGLLTNSSCEDVQFYEIPTDRNILFSHNCFQFLGDRCIPKMQEMMEKTPVGGINSVSVFTDEAERTRSHDKLRVFRHNELREFYQGWRLLYYDENILWREPSLDYLSFARIIAVKQ